MRQIDFRRSANLLHKRACFACAMLLLTLLAVEAAPAQSALATRGQSEQDNTTYLPRVLVRRFAYAGPDNQSWVAVALREFVIWRLQRPAQVDCYDSFITDEVIRRLAGQGDKKREVSAEMLTRATGVRHIVDGACTVNRVTYVAELSLTTADQPRISLDPIAGTVLLKWCDAAVQALQRTMKLEPGAAAAASWPTDSPSAWEYYARALQALDRRKLRDAYRYVLDSLGTDPRFGPGLRLRAKILAGLGDWETAGEVTRKYLRLATEAQNGRELIAARHNVGLICIQLRLTKQAEQFLRQALAEAQRLRDASDMINERVELARFFLLQKQPKQALSHYRAALSWARRVGDWIAVQEIGNQIGLIHDLAKRHDQAEKAFRQALDIARRIDDRHGQAVSLHQLGQVAHQRKHLQQALEFYRQSLAASQKHGTQDRAPATYSNMALVYKDLGQLDKALEVQQKGLAFCRQTKDELAMAASLFNLGSIYEAQKQYEQAIEAVQQARLIFERIGHPKAEKMRQKLRELQALLSK